MSKTIDPYPYKVINDRGQYVLQAAEDCKHDPETELYLLLSHHRIIDNGTELTIPDVEDRIGDKDEIEAIYARHAMLS